MAFKFKKFSVLAMAVGGVGAFVPVVLADSVAIDTSVAPWTVSREGAAATTAIEVDGGDPTQFPLSAWVKAPVVNSLQNAKDVSEDVGDPGVGLNHQAQWVSTDASGGGTNDDDGTKYVFSDTFTMDNDVNPALLDLYGTFSTDNWVTGMTLNFTINGVAHSLAVSVDSTAGDEYTYRSAFNLNGGTMSSFATPQDFTLNVDVTNSHGANDLVGGPNAGPVGLILAGTAVTVPGSDTNLYGVPLPASAGVGFSTLAGFGLLAGIRRKLSSRPRIV